MNKTIRKKVGFGLLSLCLLVAVIFAPMAVQGGQSQALNADIGLYSNLRREQVTYTRKVDMHYYFDELIPNYSRASFSNACGPLAGAITVGFYQQWHENLIPSHKSTRIVDGSPFFYSQDQYVDNTINRLETLMGGTKNGVTPTNWKKGVTAYAAEKGLKTTYNSLMSSYLIFWKKFDFSKYTAEINKHRPVLLALDKYHLAQIGTAKEGGIDEFSYVYPSKSGAHAMIGYGYRVLQYYRVETVTQWDPVWYNIFRTKTVTKENNFRNETFLMVETGQGHSGYLNINHQFNAFDAFSIYIGK